MNPPVEHVRVSTKSKDILIKIKRNIGLEHWNVICRIAFCYSLTNKTPPPTRAKATDSNIDIDWKTFAGQFQKELTALTIHKASKDGINIYNKDILADYFRDHLERGIMSLQNIKNLSLLINVN